MLAAKGYAHFIVITSWQFFSLMTDCVNQCVYIILLMKSSTRNLTAIVSLNQAVSTSSNWSLVQVPELKICCKFRVSCNRNHAFDIF